MKQLILAVVIVILPVRAVLAADFATEVVQATFKLFHPDSTSTCFLVRRDKSDKAVYLVTAGHSMERIKGEKAILVLREKKADGTYVRRDHPVPIRRGDKPLWVRHPKDDLAVLRLSEPLPIPAGALPLAALADEARMKKEGLHTCSSIFVLTYPKCFEANNAAFPVARQGIVADHPFPATQPHHRFLADFTAFAGDSGGPVFVRAKDGGPLVLGVVLAQFRHDEKVKTEYEERTIHHPLGLGTVLYAQFVRDTIEKAAELAHTGNQQPSEDATDETPAKP